MINDFIAWDKHNKRMMPSFTIQDCVNGLDTPFNVVGCIAGLDSSIYDVLQFTGKKDKKGIKIYEGFYVKHFVNGHKENPDEIITLVEWDNEYLTYHGIGGENGCGSNCEIIGNKYQNPELWKKN